MMRSMTAERLVERALLRVAARTTFTDSCWIWRGTRNHKGYPHLKVGRIDVRVHRWLYGIAIGPVGDDLTMDHLCRVRACINPDHLEPVTNRENVLRGVGPTAQNARKTMCSHGHPYTPENTGYQDSPGHAGRYCITCRRTRSRTVPPEQGPAAKGKRDAPRSDPSSRWSTF